MSADIGTSILGLIGNTPVMELRQVQRIMGFRGRLIAKMELLNPGGSMKDRIALEIIRRARADGKLAIGQPVVEVTSGNTGTGLAIVCRAMGHPFYAIISAGNTRERAQMMRALGAQVVIVEQSPGETPGRVSGSDLRRVRETAAAKVKELGAYFSDQFENPANTLAHELGTGTELWRQCGGQVDAFVSFVGSGGALAGVARHIRRSRPDFRAYAVEPAGAAALATHCCSDAAHIIQGGGYGRDTLSLLAGERIDGYIGCTDEAAAAAARMLAREEGILAGYSTGAQLHASIELLKNQEAGNTIAMLVCDTGLKYLSTDLYP